VREKRAPAGAKGTVLCEAGEVMPDAPNARPSFLFEGPRPRVARLTTTSTRFARESDADRAAIVELQEGLAAEPLPWLPSKYFYDERGSRLFEQITELPEYYLTRAETTVLAFAAGEIARAAPARELVELGGGASPKLRLLIDALVGEGLAGCLLLDISPEALRRSVASLGRDYPQLAVRGLVGDFVHDLRALGAGGGRLVAFLGSTIGNLHPEREVPAFLSLLRRQLAPGDALLLGVDLVKDRAVLEAAYNDSRGVTAEFNRNILRVVNRRFGADFDPAAFGHVAFFDEREGWIEMRLRALRPVRVRVRAAGLTLDLAAGGEIRTEISCKYTRQRVEQCARGTGLALERWFSDPERLFGLALLRPR
jgi:L-histidine N-alpha-methyltransferase